MSVGSWFVILSDHGRCCIERVKISKKINRISVTRSGVFCTGSVRVFERVLLIFFSIQVV